MTGLGSTLRERPGVPEEPVDPRDVRGGLVATGLGLAALVAYSVATDNALYLLGALIFFVGLLVSVVLHEAGHFWTARRFGMKATQFFVGFGPTLWSRHRGETEYGIKAVPAGGFVKIIGMTSIEEVAPGDEGRAFYRYPARKKTVVLAAGSFMHFVIALVLLFGSVWLVGQPQEVSPGLASISACVAPDPVIPAGATSADVDRILEQAADQDACTAPGGRPSPAAAAGLKQGDVVTAVDGQAIEDRADLILALRGAPGRAISLTVQGDGGGPVRTVSLVPAAIDRFDLDDPRRRAVVGTIGVQPQLRQDTVSQGFLGSFGATADIIELQLEGIKEVFTDKLPTVLDLYSEDRDPAGFVGVVGVGRISGEILESEETTSFKVFSMLAVVAGLNLFVGIFNLLPLLPLDGGHIAVNWYESLRHKLRRKRGYTGEIRHVDFNKLLPLTYAVAAFFALFTVALVGADLFNPVRISS